MSDIQCEIEIPEVPGLESQKLTVGRTFYYHCKGDWPSVLLVDQTRLQAVSEQGTPYDLRLLAFEFRDPKTADLLLVSYRPGPHNFTELTLTDGTQSVSLPSLNIETHSVLNPNEKVEMYGPVGPMSLSIPWAYWLILVSIVGIMILAAVWAWKRRLNRRRIMEEVKRRTTNSSPLIQFHRELRMLTKKAGLSDVDHTLKLPTQEYLVNLRSLCEIFWGQKFKVALLNQGAGTLKDEFKEQAPKVYIRYKKELLFWDQKWEDLVESSKKAKYEDIREFTLTTRELIEKMSEEER